MVWQIKSEIFFTKFTPRTRVYIDFSSGDVIPTVCWRYGAPVGLREKKKLFLYEGGWGNIFSFDCFLRDLYLTDFPVGFRFSED